MITPLSPEELLARCDHALLGQVQQVQRGEPSDDEWTTTVFLVVEAVVLEARKGPLRPGDPFTLSGTAFLRCELIGPAADLPSDLSEGNIFECYLAQRADGTTCLLDNWASFERIC